AFREGKILHKIVLEFADFATDYAVEPEWPTEALATTEQMKALLEVHNATLPKPLSLTDAATSYAALPSEFQTLAEDAKPTATAMKACVKSYNDTLPKAFKTSGTKTELFASVLSLHPEVVSLDALKVEFAAQAGERVIISQAEYQHALRYREAVLAHPEASELLSEGEAESSIYWQHDETGALLKCRPDWMRGDHVIVDLKFVRAASASAFARDGSGHNYHMQAAHYCDGYYQAFGHYPSFMFVAVEKDGVLGKDPSKPIMVGVYFYNAEDVERGLSLRDLAVRNVVSWQRENYFPGHDGMSEISVPAYQAKAETQRLEQQAPFHVMAEDDIELPESIF
ncbi:MAG: PD-(D/E)XK nuclease-like domain-containing protein, partial [Aeromonas sp.]